MWLTEWRRLTISSATTGILILHYNAHILQTSITNLILSNEWTIHILAHSFPVCSSQSISFSRIFITFKINIILLLLYRPSFNLVIRMKFKIYKTRSSSVKRVWLCLCVNLDQLLIIYNNIELFTGKPHIHFPSTGNNVQWNYNWHKIMIINIYAYC